MRETLVGLLIGLAVVVWLYRPAQATTQQCGIANAEDTLFFGGLRVNGQNVRVEDWPRLTMKLEGRRHKRIEASYGGESESWVRR